MKLTMTDASKRRLTVGDHDRNSAGMTYVYAVVSRRARGVSVGVSLNPNNACNWRCVYCQVPDLVHGKGPVIDLERLRRELATTLDEIISGSFMRDRVAEGARVLRDVAFSGNGEPTSSPSFAAAVTVVTDALRERDLVGKVRLTLITNGTMLRKPEVLAAVARMSDCGGRVWFKLDAGTSSGALRVNGQAIDIEQHLGRLRRVAAACETWVQTCMFARDGEAPTEQEQRAYLDCMVTIVEADVPIAGVLLYSLARPSRQPEAPHLSALTEAWLTRFASRIEALGLDVRVHA